MLCGPWCTVLSGGVLWRRKGVFGSSPGPSVPRRPIIGRRFSSIFIWGGVSSRFPRPMRFVDFHFSSLITCVGPVTKFLPRRRLQRPPYQPGGGRFCSHIAQRVSAPSGRQLAVLAGLAALADVFLMYQLHIGFSDSRCICIFVSYRCSLPIRSRFEKRRKNDANGSMFVHPMNPKHLI